MRSVNLKSSDTTKRVAILLKELIKRPLSYNDMLHLFDEKSKKPVYTTEVLNKYINTLRTLGLEIKRIEGKYTLLNFLYQIVLTEQEIEAFNNLETSVLKYGTDKNIKDFIDFKRKVIKFFDVKSQKAINNYIEQIFTTPLGMKVKLFEKFCDDELNIKIRYKGEVSTVEPKRVIFSENKIYFECYNRRKIKMLRLPIEKVTIMAQQPVKNKNIYFSGSVLYEIYDRLSQNYKLKEGESIIFQDDDKKVIKNESDDYEILAKRLIRYKNNCKILKPVEFQKYFKNYVKKILATYEKETF